MFLSCSRSKRLLLVPPAIFALLYIAWRITAVVHLFGAHAGIALLQTEVAQAYDAAPPDSRPAVVPRIIHQIYHNWTDPSNETLPSDWQSARQTCIDHNPGWDNRLWTSQTSRDFISDEYPWFLHTYDTLPFPIQRIDALRYFLLRHYGGIYIDLDNGCLTSLDPLRYYPAWVVDGARGALSNDILGAAPNHPFWVLVTDSIIAYAWNYGLPYVTVSYATGQWFETAMWEKYHREKPRDAPELTRIITGDAPEAEAVFWAHTRGETWHHWDNRLFMWIGENVLVVVVGVVGVVGLVVAIIVVVRRRIGVLMAGRKEGDEQEYAKLRGV